MKKLGTLMPTSKENLQSQNELSKQDSNELLRKVVDLPEDRFAKMMDWLWAQIGQTWPNAFSNKSHPLSDSWINEPEWQNQVKRLTVHQIIAGMDAIKSNVKYNDFAPRPHAFANIACELPLAKGFPEKDDIYHNVQMWRSLSDDQRMPAALWIIRYSDKWDLMLTNGAASKAEFNRCYKALTDHVIKGGELPSVVETPLMITQQEDIDTSEIDIPLSDNDSFFAALLSEISPEVTQ